MKIFVAKSINLILIIGIVYVYCTQAGKLQKNMADAGSAAQSHFADDGVYEGSGDGFGGNITVRLTVKNERLQKAEIISAKNETKDYLESAKKILDDAVKRQSTDVDTVSGDKLSSKVIIAAIMDSLVNGKVQ